MAVVNLGQWLSTVVQEVVSSEDEMGHTESALHRLANAMAGHEIHSHINSVGTHGEIELKTLDSGEPIGENICSILFLNLIGAIRQPISEIGLPNALLYISQPICNFPRNIISSFSRDFLLLTLSSMQKNLEISLTILVIVNHKR